MTTDRQAGTMMLARRRIQDARSPRTLRETARSSSQGWIGLSRSAPLLRVVLCLWNRRRGSDWCTGSIRSIFILGRYGV